MITFPLLHMEMKTFESLQRRASMSLWGCDSSDVCVCVCARVRAFTRVHVCSEDDKYRGFTLKIFFHNSIDMFSQISYTGVPQHWKKTLTLVTEWIHLFASSKE